MKFSLPLLIVLISTGFASSQDIDIELTQMNKKIVQEVFVVVGNGEYDKMDNYTATDYTRHCQATPGLNVRSLDEFKEFIRQDRLAIPDQQLEVKKLVAENDHVAFWCVYKGHQTGQMGPFPPSGKYAELDFSGVHRLENGKIVETWLTWDNLAILGQLGHLPPPPPDKE